MHDTGYKDLLSNKEVFLKLLRSFIHEDWVQEIDENNLEYINKSFILHDYSKKEADVIYKLNIKNSSVFFYCLLELQSSVDFQIPIRLLYYMTALWQEVIKNTKREELESKEFRLPAIVPLVLYNGKADWTAVPQFRDVLEGSELFGKHVLNFNYILFDVNRYTEKQLLEISNLISSIFFLDQNVNAKKELMEKLYKLGDALRRFNNKEKRLFIRWLRWILRPRIKKEYLDEFDKILDENSEIEVTKMVSNLGTAFENFMEQSYQEGQDKGKIETQKEIARKLLVLGIDLEKVAEATGLELAILKELAPTKH